MNVDTDIKLNKVEVFYEDSDGKKMSYNPRRFTRDYAFVLTVYLDLPQLDKIEIELSAGNRPSEQVSNLYLEYDWRMRGGLRIS